MDAVAAIVALVAAVGIGGARWLALLDEAIPRAAAAVADAVIAGGGAGV